MNKRQLKGIVAVSLLSVSVACTDGIGTGFSDGTGKIALVTEIDASVAAPRQSRTEYDAVTGDDLTLKLTAADGSYAETWSSVGDFPVDKTFKVGTYTLEAYYGDETLEGFEVPRFYGKTTLVVEENLTTPVTLKVPVASALITIKYTDALMSYMTEYSAEVHSAAGSYITFESDETRPAYVNPGQVDVNVSFTKPNGKGGKLNVATFEAVAAHRYNVTIDLGGDGAGEASLVITFDDDMIEDPRPVDISDDVLNAPAPEVTPVGFTPGEPVLLMPGGAPDQALKYNIIARGELAAVTLTTRSAALSANGWPAEINLIDADDATVAALKEMGLSALGIFKNPEKLAMVDLTGVVGKIAYLNGGDNTSEFTLVAKDRSGKVSEPVTLTVEALPLNFVVTDAKTYIGSPVLTFDLEYNGGNPAEGIKMEYFNTRGTWSTVTPTYDAIGKSTYSVTAQLTSADLNAAAKLRFTVGENDPINLTVERLPMVITDKTARANMYATHGNIPVTIGAGDSNASLLSTMLSNATVQVSTDGVNFKNVATSVIEAAKTLAISGLVPGTTYTVRIANGGIPAEIAPVTTLTTEPASQLANGDFEAEPTIPESASNWEYVVFEGWGTNNYMTTVNVTGAMTNYAYDKISGTKATTDAHSGSQAVRLRTNGWGAGNSALSGVNGKCNYLDPGLLHLGATRTARPAGYTGISGPLTTDDLDCGIPFESRPASLSFWYKYVPKNAADHGHVLVELYDAAGNVIASASKDLAKQGDSYAEVVLPLNYVSDAKAAKVYVRFLSTNVPDALTKNSSWLTGPGFGNLSRGEYRGSDLYIDDVVFNY